MDTATITGVLRTDFGALWTAKPHGRTIEVTTPFPTMRGDFVSVFIRKFEEGYVVTDGGWLAGGDYIEGLRIDDASVSRWIESFADAHSVMRHAEANQFFRKASDISRLSSAVFDVASFVGAVINAKIAADMDGQSASERFSTRANQKLVQMVAASQYSFKPNFKLEPLQLTFSSAIIRGTHIHLLQYVTGWSPQYLRDSACRAGSYFELAEKNKGMITGTLASRTAVLDTDSGGMRDSAIRNLVGDILPLHTTRVLRWDEVASARDCEEFLLTGTG